MTVNAQADREGRRIHCSSPGRAKVLIAGLLLLGCTAGLLPGCKDVTQEQTAPVAGPMTTPAVGAPSQVTTVADEIDAVLSRMRRANLDEQIDAFMAHYGAGFPDRAAKRQQTLETWRKYDFASLDYFVFDLKVSGTRADAAVGWEIALQEEGSREPQLIETTNQVVLEKGTSGWQIVSLQ